MMANISISIRVNSSFLHYVCVSTVKTNGAIFLKAFFPLDPMERT